MRPSLLAIAAGLTLSTTQASITTSSQWIVIGTNGQVLEVDPAPYKPEARRLRRLLAIKEEERKRNATRLSALLEAKPIESAAVPPHVDEVFFDDEEDLLEADEGAEASDPVIPDVETLMVASDTSTHAAWLEEIDEDESQALADSNFGALQLERINSSLSHDGTKQESSFVLDFLVAFDDQASSAAVQGSVVFAELSCLFMGFIAYLVLSLPLWSSFSRGQKCCLLVAFGAAFMYQIVVLFWYHEILSPDVTLSISSLITRTISLGMVPITTSSFMNQARATAAAVESKQEKPEKPRRLPASLRRKARSS